MNKTKIRVLFDANPLAQNHKSGVGYYTEGVIKSLAENYPNNIELVGHYYNFLGRKRPNLPVAPNIRYKSSFLLPGKLVNVLKRVGIFLPFELLVKSRGDIIFFPNYFALPSLFRTPIFTTIHDLYFMVQPSEVSARNVHALKRYIPHTLKTSTKILTISEFSKHELIKYFDVNVDRIFVAPIPPSEPLTLSDDTETAALQKFRINKDCYILFIGNVEPRKNLVNLIKAFRQLPQAFKQKHPLVIAGGKGWRDQEIIDEIAAAKKAHEPIIQTGYVSDNERAALYKNAAAMVMPSKYEGFGMQLLEAMSYNTPVLASDIPVFRETAEEAILYFNPLDIESVSRAMMLIENSQKMNAARKEQKKIIAMFSWKKTSAEIYQLFTSVK